MGDSLSAKRKKLVIPQQERAVLTVDLRDKHLKAGDAGTVVDICRDGAAYEIEFFTLDGRTLDVVTVEPTH
jgi:hypothetical protein